MDFHDELADNLLIERGLLNNVIHAEADIATLDLAFKIASILSACGFRVAILEVCFPREILDANRVREHSLHRVFDHDQYPGLVDPLMGYYDSVVKETERLLALLKPGGKKLDLHSMRDFGTSMDSTKPPQDLDASALEKYYRDRELALRSDASYCRTSSLITAHEDARDKDITDPILLLIARKLFARFKIPFNINGVYCFFRHVFGAQNPQYYGSALLPDLTKSKLCKTDKSGRVNLIEAEADKEKVESIAFLLAQILIEARERTLEMLEFGAPSFSWQGG